MTSVASGPPSLLQKSAEKGPFLQRLSEERHRDVHPGIPGEAGLRRPPRPRS